MDTLTPTAPTTIGKNGFVPLGIATLRCLGATNFDLFIWNTQINRMVLFREADHPLEEPRLRELAAQCGEYLYVRDSAYEQVCEVMFAKLETVTSDESIPPTQRFGLLQTAMSFEVERRLASKDANDYMRLVNRVGKHIRTLVGDSQILPSSLYHIAKHDDATFAHVTNVAGYATVLAKNLGITKSEEVDEIITGAMLHDIGKRFISKAILRKTGRLTDEERELIRSHPLLGYEDLVDQHEVTHAQRMMVYQHHEHIDGQGYPVRALGDEIHPWAKLLAVVDVFDAVTGRRPYRVPMTMREALEYIADRAGTQFDKEMAQCWVSAIEAN